MDKLFFIVAIMILSLEAMSAEVCSAKSRFLKEEKILEYTMICSDPSEDKTLKLTTEDTNTKRLVNQFIKTYIDAGYEMQGTTLKEAIFIRRN